jgi:16S rRNA (guanine(527)-N(7))-methyltransferase RsmG
MPCSVVGALRTAPTSPMDTMDPRLIAVHRELLERFRHSMNLVGPGPVQEHYDDCDCAMAGLSPEGHWVDLGTGAGFPGIPLAARWTDLRVDLVDSRRKRCIFLEHVLEEAEVDPGRVQVICDRAENLSGPYDGVVSRAFTAPDGFLDHAARLLRPGGVAVLFLQGDAEVPGDDRFEAFHVEPYRLGTRHRKSVALQRR